MLYDIAKPFVALILRIIWRPRIEGAENIPAHGPVVLASNHLAMADTIVMPALVRRKVHFLAKADYYSGGGLPNRMLGLVLRSIGVMPINRSGGAASRSAIAAGVAVLERGRVLGIYPEGTRSPDGRLYRGKTGVARMALEVGCPIVPIAMAGTFEAQKGRRVLPRRRPRMRALVGEPIDPRGVADASGATHEGARQRAVTDAVMTAIARMSGQEQVAEYAADVKRRLRPGDGAGL